jgi:hypothetical protein
MVETHDLTGYMLHKLDSIDRGIGEIKILLASAAPKTTSSENLNLTALAIKHGPEIFGILVRHAIGTAIIALAWKQGVDTASILEFVSHALF